MVIFVGDSTTEELAVATCRRRKTAQYTGTHTIECFIVKDDYLVARSGRIEVNVR